MKRHLWTIIYRVTLVTLLAIIAWQAVKLGGTVSSQNTILTWDVNGK